MDDIMIERLYERAITQAETNRNTNEKIFLPLIINKEVMNIRMSNILYAEKLQRRVVITMTDQNKHEVIDTMNHIEKMLSSSFLRISQSVIVNKKEIKQYGRKNIIMSTGDELVIGSFILFIMPVIQSTILKKRYATNTYQ